MLPIRIRHPIIGSVQQPIQPDPSPPPRPQLVAAVERDLGPEVTNPGGVAVAFHASADPRPLRNVPSINLGETFIPPPGSSVAGRNRYGVSNLPANRVIVLGESAQPWPGGSFASRPAGIDRRDATSRTVALAQDTAPPDGRATYTSMPLETSRPGVKTFARVEEQQPFAGFSFSTSAAAKNQRTTNPPSRVSAEPPPMDAGAVLASWHVPVLMRLPGRVAVLATPFTPDDSPAPQIAHGAPPRDALSRLRVSPQADLEPPAEGRTWASHAVFGSFPTPARPVVARGESAAFDLGAAKALASRAAHRRTSATSIVVGDVMPPESGQLMFSRSFARPAVAAPRPSIVADSFAASLLTQPTIITAFVPRTPYVAPLIGVVVYLTGRDNSIVSIDPAACCGDCDT